MARPCSTLIHLPLPVCDFPCIEEHLKRLQAEADALDKASRLQVGLAAALALNTAIAYLSAPCSRPSAMLMPYLVPAAACALLPT